MGLARIATRVFALIALAAVAVAVYVIVHGQLHHSPANTSSHSTTVINGRSTTSHHRRRTPKYYTVRSGDTLSAISIRTHVSIFRLTQLNPGLSPNALQTGARLRLRR
ncbi:MAG TPA: LysM domain-containing protein [Solirubrobacteraceae bacterium]|nr:LysM domain-containing protein [Solirubrobacteraceae bacterium]